VKLARNSAIWVGVPFSIALLLAVLSIWSLSIAALALTFFMAFFHRDPERVPPGEGMVSPADGLVVDISPEKVAIFMNHYNVHVNRAPLEGRVMQIEHVDGGHLPAFFRSSSQNEQNLITIDTPDGEMVVHQITGAFVRRIVCYLEPGSFVKRGERIGMIRFGSRVEFTLPAGYSLSVRKGERVKAGETVIAVKTT